MPLSGGAGLEGYGYGGGGAGYYSGSGGGMKKKSVNPFGGYGGGLTSTNTPQMPYQPNAPAVQGLIDPLAKAGQGLLDPNSDYFKQLMGGLTGAIGEQSAAQGRAAQVQASRAGLGAGASPELLETQGDISRAGLGAMGEAGANFRLQAPQMGAQMLQPALQGQLGLQSQNLQAWLAQQQLQQQNQNNQANFDLQRQQMLQDQMMREMALLYGGY